MIQTHGLKNGVRRFWDEIMENRLFDRINGVETADIITEKDFYNLIKQNPSGGANWYQPTYASPIVKTLRFLQRTHLSPYMRTLFIDLGVGKGKPCIIAAKYLKSTDLVGIDLSPELLRVCEENFRKLDRKITLIEQNVRDVDYCQLFEKYDTIIIHNKNSFDKNITSTVLKNIEAAKSDQTVFYIYNNPIYKELFAPREPILILTGWHKNFNLNLYKI